MQPTQNPTEQSMASPKSPSKKGIILLAGLLLTVIAAAVAWLSWMAISDRNDEETPPAAVTITSGGFSPSTIVVKKGGDIVWMNEDTKPHSITGDQEDLGLKTPEPIEQGESYSFVFDETGTYTYHDPTDPTFRATVVVE
jgi:plastocyanin